MVIACLENQGDQFLFHVILAGYGYRYHNRDMCRFRDNETSLRSSLPVVFHNVFVWNVFGRANSGQRCHYHYYSGLAKHRIINGENRSILPLCLRVMLPSLRGENNFVDASPVVEGMVSDRLNGSTDGIN